MLELSLSECIYNVTEEKNDIVVITTDDIYSKTVLVKAGLPRVILNLNSTSVQYGKSLNISWSTINADSCVASGGWFGSKSTSSSSEIISNIIVENPFTLTCTNSKGSSSKTVNFDLTYGVWIPLKSNTIDSNSYMSSSIAIDGDQIYVFGYNIDFRDIIFQMIVGQFFQILNWVLWVLFL